MVIPRLLMWLLLVGLVASCATTPSSGPPAMSVADTCVEPPASEQAPSSSVTLTVDPNPVTAGSVATLSVDSDGLPTGALSGAVAWWQCWNGTEWVDTHLIGRGWGVNQPTTIAVGPEPTVAIGDIGLPVPNSYPVVIPEVAPGLYRIRDKVVIPGPEAIAGYVWLEVVSGHSKGETGPEADGSRSEVTTPSGRMLDCPSDLIESATFDVLADAVGSDTPQAALDRFQTVEHFTGEPAVEEQTSDEVVFVFTDIDGNRLGRVFVGLTDNGWFALGEEQCGQR